MDKLSPSERIIGVAGILLFLDSFVPWFRRCFGIPNFEVCVGHNAWSNVLSLLAVLLGVIMVAQIVVAKFTAAELPRLGTLTWGHVHLIAGVAALVLVLLQVIVGDAGFGRAVGAYLGILFAAALAYGGFLRSKEPESRGGAAPRR